MHLVEFDNRGVDIVQVERDLPLDMVDIRVGFIEYTFHRLDDLPDTGEIFLEAGYNFHGLVLTTQAFYDIDEIDDVYVRVGVDSGVELNDAVEVILGGAAGNLIDRVFYGGSVVDFIEMSWRGHIFPVYNVADMGVSIGAALLVLALLREGDPEQEALQHEEPIASPDEASEVTHPRPEASGSETASPNS